MKAIIEIPKGSNRRIHIKNDKAGFVDLGLIKDKITANNGIMPVNYGFIPETFNEFDGDELDVCVLSNKILETGTEAKIRPIALVIRADNDHKVIATDNSIETLHEWADIPDNEKNKWKIFLATIMKFCQLKMLMSL
jgi:inorganic pyrophosphatase